MRIKEWLKFFGLSYFSDKQASCAPQFGFIAVVLNIVLAFVFFMCGYYAADVVPFSAHYENATGYKRFIENAFSDRLEIKVSNGKAVCDEKVNGYISDEGYGLNGYKLIVDTRPSDMLINFTQVAIKGESEISYEEYRELSDAQKKEYKVETRYTDSHLEFTEDATERYEAFLSADENLKKQYEELDKSAGDYNEKLYYLYVKYYYTSANSIMYGAKAPVLRDYYYKNYIAGGKAYYLYIFDDKGRILRYGGIYFQFVFFKHNVFTACNYFDSAYICAGYVGNRQGGKKRLGKNLRRMFENYIFVCVGFCICNGYDDFRIGVGSQRTDVIFADSRNIRRRVDNTYCGILHCVGNKKFKTDCRHRTKL